MAQQMPSITKRVLAKQMAKKFNMSLSNAYNHIYIELSDSLIPSGIIEQDGIVPATRGPRIFQTDGIPCFRLSEIGVLVACSLDEVDVERRALLFREYVNSSKLLNQQQDSRKDELLFHLQTYPEFTLELLKHGVLQYLKGKLDHPLSVLPSRKEGHS
jgi:hypothetical protein